MVQLDCHQNDGTSGASFIPQIWVRSKQTNKQTNRQTNKQTKCMYIHSVCVYIKLYIVCVYIAYIYIYVCMYQCILCLYIFVKSKLEVSSGLASLLCLCSTSLFFTATFSLLRWCRFAPLDESNS